MDDLGKDMTLERGKVLLIFVVTFNVCWFWGQCSFCLGPMALLAFRAGHFGCSKSYSYLSQLFWVWQFSLFDFAQPIPTLSLPGRVRLFWLCLCFSLVQKNCYVVTFKNTSCSLSGIPFNRLHCDILGVYLYHIETKNGSGKAKSLWCQPTAKPEIKLDHISACLTPLFVLPFSFPITSPMS